MNDRIYTDIVHVEFIHSVFCQSCAGKFFIFLCIIHVYELQSMQNSSVYFMFFAECYCLLHQGKKITSSRRENERKNESDAKL